MKIKYTLPLLLIISLASFAVFGQKTSKGAGNKNNKPTTTPVPTPTPTTTPMPTPTPAVVVNTPMPTITSTTQSVSTPRKKRIAVLNFEFANIAQTSPYQNQQISIGRGFTTTLITKLVQEGTYTIVERGQIDKVLEELKLGNTLNMDKETTARIGRILGVDALLYGTFTKVGPKGKNANIFDSKSSGTGTIGTITNMLGGSGKNQIELILNFFVANAETAEILQVPGSITAVSKKKTLMTPEGLEDDVLREAFDDAISKIVTNLVSSGNLIPDATFDVNGEIVDVDGNNLMTNLGKNSGVRVGDRLAVNRVLKVIYDKDQKTVLDYRMEKIGELVITKINEKTSIGTYTPLNNFAPNTNCRVTRN